MRIHLHLVALVAAAAVGSAIVSAGGSDSPTLDRIQSTHRMRMGYRTDARPFAYTDPRGEPDGYSVSLCRQIAEAVQAHLHMSELPIDWIKVSAQEHLDAVRKGDVDLLCGASTISLERRKLVAFSIPIFPGGIGALVRADAPARLKNVLSGRGQPFHPTWRASVGELLQFRAFAAIQGATSETWLRQRIHDMQIITDVMPVSTYKDGIDAVLARRADALFGERAILLDAVRTREQKDLLVTDRQFTYEPLGLVMGRDDEPFRLVVDRTLAQFYAFNHISGLYARWFGEPDDNTIAFFKWSTVPD